MSHVAEQLPLDRVVIRFAGDSGDGMQLTGDRFTAETASFGNDIATLPNFPAEIRAPQGTLPGVSSFQLHFANFDIVTPGDVPDVLVAMNPAALKANLRDLPRGGVIIVDTADFTKRNLAKIGWAHNPLEDGSLSNYSVHALDLTGLATGAVSQFDLTRKDASRTKNMFALGLLSWLYSRPTEGTLSFLSEKFAKKPTIRDANIAAFKAGYAYGETTEAFEVRYHVAPAPMKKGRYRQISGNLATAYGLITGAQKAGLQLFLGSYPITPASDILHELSRRKDLGVMTFQAEDEIAGVGSAIGASFAGALGVTTTSGPGMALKGEAIGLAVMTELPLVIVNVQRSGPSTGMPTKTEQADLMQALYGRNGEAPVPVLAAKSAADCFDTAIEACRIAVTYRTPVIMLSDGYLANGAEPWRLPDLSAIPAIEPGFATAVNATDDAGKDAFHPYERDPETLARAWAVPGTPGLEHRIGGIEKAARTGNVSYDPDNHEYMTRTRQAKIDGIVRDIPDIAVEDPSGSARVLVLGWGSTFGPITAAARRVRLSGRAVATAHLRHLNPMPANLGEVLRAYDKVVVPEMNLGQLATILQARYLVEISSYSRVRGLPISLSELEVDLIAEIDALQEEN
ncbi:2-oxoglutarate ferredoxin oxidoreductase subunit alpha [Tessaracoccus lapidicaptus]|uniref:2-oxoglutarate ferredoxin oxidoreductase subunit alpha n=1 Tax=Tessaracoccus lapidicaptus TaxID=1427523 RepID=A0A1C0AHA2_9ACTN|nr:MULTISPECIES: 2-oxoacid:acceptor oxidoreductase subunit alpha [Tessaracoccus]AQX16522.1 2-oxoglutarate ferredoxin oxidoreductase subunit alpha [Tessaracoccus sp. T2.5-30]OCL31378.1 2-oxoglutarate ferredoxin oxidoreductase subunit alpha [Tessaracoccus lapidicaptus]VEP41190.1 2-oxoglutarate oxidoreductase subunit KorA [Tessaracoccus lapidicaptus]